MLLICDVAAAYLPFCFISLSFCLDVSSSFFTHVVLSFFRVPPNLTLCLFPSLSTTPTPPYPTQEVIIVEDDNGEIVREQTKDTEVIAQYKTMRETIVYLTNLNYEDTEAIMLEKLDLQVRGVLTVSLCCVCCFLSIQHVTQCDIVEF